MKKVSPYKNLNAFFMNIKMPKTYESERRNRKNKRQCCWVCRIFCHTFLSINKTDVEHLIGDGTYDGDSFWSQKL